MYFDNATPHLQYVLKNVLQEILNYLVKYDQSNMESNKTGMDTEKTLLQVKWKN